MPTNVRGRRPPCRREPSGLLNRPGALWWKLGALFGAVFFAVYLLVTPAWMSIVMQRAAPANVVSEATGNSRDVVAPGRLQGALDVPRRRRGAPRDGCGRAPRT